MKLSSEDRSRIRAEEEYRFKIFSDLNKPAKPSTWDRINSPIVIWVFGSIILSLISFGYAKYSDSLKIATEMRALSYGVQIRLDPIEKLIPEVIEAGFLDDNQRYRISNSFTGKMEQALDSFGKVGVPNLLFRYSALSGNSKGAIVAREYLALMVALEQEGLYARGGVGSGVEITATRRASLQRLLRLTTEAKETVSNSAN